MRARVVLAFVSLLVPAGAGAQIAPLPGGGRVDPTWPVPLSPQPAPIARLAEYRRMRISVESYPLVGVVHAPGLVEGGATSWAIVGTGSRAEYRLDPTVSVTLDVTSSFAGSPIVAQTAELGTRFGRERTESRAYPFADLRVGFATAVDRNRQSFGGYGSPSRSSSGVGVVAGGGMEYLLTRTLSLTAAASVMHSRMTAQDFTSSRVSVPSFGMTAYRVAAGLRYNPVRLVMP